MAKFCTCNFAELKSERVGWRNIIGLLDSFGGSFEI